jgi:hypothetical protein
MFIIIYLVLGNFFMYILKSILTFKKGKYFEAYYY